MGSKRLPGKVLLDLGGEPMLVRVVERSRRARALNSVVVATTTEPGDDPIAALCAGRGYACYRGASRDVLDRYYRAAQEHGAGVIVRITADCPLIDPDLIDETIRAFRLSGVDFAANRLPPPWKRTYPIGLDTEVCSFEALEHAWREADLPFHREHVMPYLYQEAGRFQTLILQHDPDYGHLRWTVDTPEDLAVMRAVFAHFDGRDKFSWKDVVALFEQRPELARLNAAVRHKSVEESELHESQRPDRS